MKVTAIKRGFCGHKLRKPGEKFEVADDSALGSWMIEGWGEVEIEETYPGKLEIPPTKEEILKAKREEKPKRKRRTKAEIEADKAKEEE